MKFLASNVFPKSQGTKSLTECNKPLIKLDLGSCKKNTLLRSHVIITREVDLVLHIPAQMARPGFFMHSP